MTPAGSPGKPAKPVEVCGLCGGVDEDVATAIRYRDQMVETLRGDLEGAEEENRRLRRRNRELRAEQDLALRNHKFYDDAIEVLGYWQKTCSPKAREIASKPRLANCIARLNGGYTKDELKRSVYGYSLKPFMVQGRRTHDGPKDSWRADAELIFRDAQHVDQGLRIAERADDLQQALEPVQAAPRPSAGPEAALSPLGQAAVRLAGHGFYVFPCKPREKVPATRNGLNDAKRELDAIRAYWTQRPHANIGIRTGALSGIVVLDVDGDEGWDSLHKLEDSHDPLPSTASITTPRGGQHFYFTHPGWDLRNTTGFPGPGLDLRGDGGYVLAPPSVGPGGRPYAVDEQGGPAPMPDWLLEMIRSYQSKQDKALSGAIDWPAFLAAAPSQGERNARMTKYVGHLFGHAMTAREVYATAQLLNAQAKPPLGDKELAAIVRSIQRAEARK